MTIPALARLFKQFSSGTRRRRSTPERNSPLAHVQLLESRQLLSAAPVISNLGPQPTYMNDFVPVPVAPTAEVSDTDGDFANSYLSVQLNTSNENYVLVLTPGNGVGYNGSVITVDGVEVGFYSIGYGSEEFGAIFNSQATGSIVERVTRQVSFVVQADNIPISSKIATFQLTDGSGLTSQPVQQQLNISSAPVLNQTYSYPVFYRPGSAPAFFGSGIVYRNAGADDAGSRFVIQNINWQAGDRVGVYPGNGVTTDGNQISYAGNVVATFSGGQNSVSLKINFNGSANFAAIRAVLSQITYQSTSNPPALGDRQIEVTAFDGGGRQSNTVTASIRVINNLQASNPGAPVTYTAGGTGSLVIPQVVINGGSSFFAGLTVELVVTGGRGKDQLFIKGHGAVAVEGTNILYNGTVVGTLASESAGSVIKIRFNELATRTIVTNVLRRVAFTVDSPSPNTLTRNVGMILTDATGYQALGNGQIQSINVISPPVVVLQQTDLTYRVGGSPRRVAWNSRVLDASGKFADSTVVFRITRNKAGDLLSIYEGNGVTVVNDSILVDNVVVATFQGGSSGVPLTIQFHENATQVMVQSVVRNVVYSNSLNSPSLEDRTIKIQFTNGEGVTAAVVEQKIQLTL